MAGAFSLEETMHIISIHFPAGGVAKSLTTWALASYLSTKFRVLVIDLDAQATTTNTFVDEIPHKTVYELLLGKVDIDEVIEATTAAYPENLFLIPASSQLSNLELETASQIDRHYMLLDRLDGLSDFDFVLVDTPPNTGICTVNSLTGNYVLPPIVTDPKSFDQIDAFESLIRQVKRRINPQLQLLGVLPTKHNHTVIAREALNALNERFGSLCFQPIHSTVRLMECMAQGAPPWNQEKSEDYKHLTNSILRKLNYEKEVFAENR